MSIRYSTYHVCAVKWTRVPAGAGCTCQLVLLLLNWCEWKSSFDFGASGNDHLILDIGGLRSASQIYQRDFRFFVASVSGSTGATLRVLGFFGIGFRVMGLGGWG